MTDEAAQDINAKAEKTNHAWITGGRVYFEFLTRALVIGAFSYAGGATGNPVLQWIALFSCVAIGAVTAAEINQFSRLFWPKQSARAGLVAVAMSIAVTAVLIWLVTDIFAGAAA